jgi:small-conductance mechanosensitive channel
MAKPPSRSLADVFTHVEDTKKSLAQMNRKLDRLLSQQVQHMATSAENAAALAAIKQQITDATTNLAGDIERLSGTLNTGMDQAAVDAAVAGFQEVADKLKALADVTPEGPSAARR